MLEWDAATYHRISDPQWNWIHQLDDVPKHLLREITHFFSIYKDLEDGKNKKVTVGGWQSTRSGGALCAPVAGSASRSTQSYYAAELLPCCTGFWCAGAVR